MEYVIDASVALKWFLPELHTGQARVLLDSLLRGDAALCGPDILAAEVGNTLWKRSAGRGELSILKAR